MRYVAPLLAFISGISALIATDEMASAATSYKGAPPEGETKDSVAEITFCFVGDLMCHSPQYNAARTPDGSYNFVPSFEYVAPYFEAADFTIGNLETTCAGAKRGYAGYPNFNAPDEYVVALKQAGFDMLVTSNNHSMDTGEEGLLRTIGVIKKNGLQYAGTFVSQQDHDSLRIVNVKGLKAGIINYTYGTNGAYPSASHKYMLNVYDSSAVRKEIDALRKNGVDLVIALFHWGVEYRADPMWPKQDSMMRCAMASGADLIIGGHPHVVGPVTYYKTQLSKVDTGLVAWTMGNFISNQSKRYTDAGLILNVTLKKNTANDSVWIAGSSYVPTWVYRGTSAAKKDFVVLPSAWSERDSLPSWIDAASKAKMKEAHGDTKAVVLKYQQKTTPAALKDPASVKDSGR